jgi:hypothetical protein
MSYILAIPLWGGLQYAAAVAAKSRADAITSGEYQTGDNPSVAEALLEYERETGSVAPEVYKRAMVNLGAAENRINSLLDTKGDKDLVAELVFRRLDEWKETGSQALISESLTTALAVNSPTPIQSTFIYLSALDKAGLPAQATIAEEGIELCLVSKKEPLCWQLHKERHLTGRAQHKIYGVKADDLARVLAAVHAAAAPAVGDTQLKSALGAIPEQFSQTITQPLAFAVGLQPSIGQASPLFSRYFPQSNQRVLQKLYGDKYLPALMNWLTVAKVDELDPGVRWKAIRDQSVFGFINPVLPLLAFAWEFYTPVETVGGAQVVYDVSLYQSLVPGAALGVCALTIYGFFIIRRKRQSNRGKEYNLRNA